ncbi:Transposon Ty3-I Gag-Pol polyprotein [Gossypium australe]|uniref:Transposon Ty3-I Gag-Pol polyprotein n=1 Tax=Gossypium australe TaxID=47621 RepID=A0A5B6WQ58_9ROSI|nr:Transposon Ty3-I Gag-Pol polyprotein [Gossypium australe]
MRMVVDASANVALVSKSYNKTYEIIERISSNNDQPTNKPQEEVAGIHEVDAFTSLVAQVSLISLTLNNFTTNGFNNVVTQPPNQFENIACVYCGEGHLFENFRSNPESVFYMGRQEPESNFYNPSWRNHLKFSWSNQGVGPSNTYVQPRPTQPPKPPQLEPSNSLENLLKVYMTKNDVTLRNLENQVSIFPNDTKNPRNSRKEHCKALTLKTGKTLEPNIIEIEEQPADAREKMEVQPSVETPVSPDPESVNSNKKKCHSRGIALYKLGILHPPTLKGFKNKTKKSSSRTLEKMPNYVKFMKDILSKKMRL